MRLQDFPNIKLDGFSEPRIDRQLDWLVVAPSSDRPATRTLRNVLHVPGQAGLYDETGQRLDVASPYYVEPGVAMDLNDRAKYLRMEDHWADALIPPSRVEKAVRSSETAVFLGSYFGHFGHWITDGTSRLWGHLKADRGLHRLFHAAGGHAKHAGGGHIRNVCERYGLEDVVLSKGDLKVYDTVIVFDPAMQMRHKIYDNADETHVSYAKSLDGLDRYAGRKIYLSRSRVNTPLRTIKHEDEVEHIFATRGFDIVHSQELSFDDQVRMFNSAAVLAGFDGSAFHLGMFSLRDFGGHLEVLSGTEPINTRLVLQQTLKGSSCTFSNSYDFADKTVLPNLDRVREIAANL